MVDGPELWRKESWNEIRRRWKGTSRIVSIVMIIKPRTEGTIEWGVWKHVGGEWSEDDFRWNDGFLWTREKRYTQFIYFNSNSTVNQVDINEWRKMFFIWHFVTKVGKPRGKLFNGTRRNLCVVNWEDCVIWCDGHHLLKRLINNESFHHKEQP